MSQITLSSNASGTGIFTIASPNSNTNRTLTLPDNTGTVLTSASSIDATTLTGDVAAARITGALNATGSAPIYAARAWVNFNGTGTVAIRASGNVSSITDNGTGDYTVNFTTAFADVNYSAVATTGDANNGRQCMWEYISGGVLVRTTSSIRYITGSPSIPGAYAQQNSDNITNNVAVFR